MSYEPQPGTIPHRAIAWLRAMQRCSEPGTSWSTAEICEALDADTVSFASVMQPARHHGVVRATRINGGRALYWCLGRGEPDAIQRERDEPLPEWKPPQFRALMFEGQLLVTGMEVRDGVAILAPSHWMEIKRVTDWAYPPARGAA